MRTGAVASAVTAFAYAFHSTQLEVDARAAILARLVSTLHKSYTRNRQHYIST